MQMFGKEKLNNAKIVVESNINIGFDTGIIGKMVLPAENHFITRGSKPIFKTTKNIFFIASSQSKKVAGSPKGGLFALARDLR